MPSQSRYLSELSPLYHVYSMYTPLTRVMRLFSEYSNVRFFYKNSSSKFSTIYIAIYVGVFLSKCYINEVYLTLSIRCRMPVSFNHGLNTALHTFNQIFIN